MNIFTAEALRNREDRTTGVSEYRDISTSEHRVIGTDPDATNCSDHPITRDHSITRSAPCCHPEQAGATAMASRRIYGSLRKLFEVLTATIREIFDESAYDRFLSRTQETRSAASYRSFLEERQTGVARRLRCC